MTSLDRNESTISNVELNFMQMKYRERPKKKLQL